ncbi:hypothetical protein L6452_10091 [Arctium lappa]|uniref:Uncharacterized protein n=1 Tax=Arctium lappa TaxID=4217 RepID=A0ACB9DM82_ARCLA|nr:hypothetical protein L6452_10091 [Arctium lappa]
MLKNFIFDILKILVPFSLLLHLSLIKWGIYTQDGDGSDFNVMLNTIGAEMQEASSQSISSIRELDPDPDLRNEIGCRFQINFDGLAKAVKKGDTIFVGQCLFTLLAGGNTFFFLLLIAQYRPAVPCPSIVIPRQRLINYGGISVVHLSCEGLMLHKLRNSALCQWDMLQTNGMEEVPFSFNGGKDSAVLLHLLRAGFFLHQVDYGHSNGDLSGYGPSAFPEINSFTYETASSYGVQLDILHQDFKSGLEALLKTKPTAAISPGVRIGDPTAKQRPKETRAEDKEILFGTVEDQLGPSLCRKLHNIGWTVSRNAVVRSDVIGVIDVNRSKDIVYETTVEDGSCFDEVSALELACLPYIASIPEPKNSDSADSLPYIPCLRPAFFHLQDSLSSILLFIRMIFPVINAGSHGGTVPIWEFETARCIKIWGLGEPVHHVAWNPLPELPILAVPMIENEERKGPLLPISET